MTFGAFALAGIAWPSCAFAQSTADVTAANRQVFFDSVPLNRKRNDKPQYGNPPASGASKTGFDSTNARTKKTRKQIKQALTPKPEALQPLLPPDPVAPATYMRPQPRITAPAQIPKPMLAPNAEIYADGTVAPVTNSVAKIVQHHRALVPVVEPFDPLGMRLGAFIVKPAIEFSAGYDSNPARTPTGKGSSLLVAAPEVLAKSDWERHELTATLRGSYMNYNDLPNFSRPALDGKLNTKIDVSSQTRLEFEGRGQYATDSPGDPNFPTGVSKPPVYTVFGGTGGIAHRFNRLELSAKGTVDRTKYESSTLNNGATLDNSDLNYIQYGTTLRGSYEVGPGVKPFIEIGFDTRKHDNPIDTFGVARDSNGMMPRIGTTFELSRGLTGEVSVGYLTRHYQDPNLADLRGGVLDASLVWVASALTKATFTAKTTADESRIYGISGILKHDIGFQVDHAFRQWLILTGKVGTGIDDYQGSDREDHRYLLSGLLTYKLNRNVWLKSEVRQEWFKSNIPNNDYAATTFLLGLRFQQ